MLAQKLLKVMDWFLHPDILKDQHTVQGAETIWKSRLTLGVAFTCSFFLLVMFIIRTTIQGGLEQKTLLLLPIFGVIFATFPYIFVKKMNNIFLPNFLLLSFGCLILPARVLNDGGVSSSTLAWFTLWPILPTLIMTPRWGGIFTGIGIVEILLLAQAKSLHLPVKTSSPPELVRASIVIVLILIIYFVVKHFELERVRQFDRLRDNEKQLGSVVKFESLAKMAEGLAHEVNNPMTIAVGNLAKLKKELRNESELKKVEKIERSLERVNALIKRLQFFSKRDMVLSIEEFDLQKICANQVLKAQLYDTSGKIRLVNNIRRPYHLFADKIKVEMVFEILLMNSVDALHESAQAIKEVRLDITENDTEYIISIIDNGPGINNQIRDRIMDPFFTTKGDQNNSGLGLSLAKGIIEKHHGKLEFYSNSRVTTFNIIMPKPLSIEERNRFQA